MQSTPTHSRKAAITIAAAILFIGTALSLYLFFAPAIKNQKATSGGASPAEPVSANPQESASYKRPPHDSDKSITKPSISQDVQSAHAAMKCLNLASELSRIEYALNTHQNVTLPIILVKSEKDLDQLTARLGEIRASQESECRGLDRMELISSAGSLVRRAAQEGDVDSQLCVMEQRFLDPRTKGLTEDEAEHRLENLEKYHSDAYRRGDWRIVQLDALRALTVGHGPIGSHLLDTPPVGLDQYYKSLLLLRKGAEGDYAKSLDSEIERIRHLDSSPDTGRTPMLEDERVEAEKKADEEYSAFFSKSQRLQSPPAPCGGT